MSAYVCGQKQRKSEHRLEVVYPFYSFFDKGRMQMEQAKEVLRLKAENRLYHECHEPWCCSHR